MLDHSWANMGNCFGLRETICNAPPAKWDALLCKIELQIVAGHGVSGLQFQLIFLFVKIQFSSNSLTF